MQHKVKLSVIDKKVYPELQKQYCKDPESGECPCYNIGDEFIFERYKESDDFWHVGMNTLKQTEHSETEIAGGSEFPHCSEAWDAISRYIYTGLQGGSIMRGWMNDERIMIACCSDGTRPVIFKIERMDYKAVHLGNDITTGYENKIKKCLEGYEAVNNVIFYDEFFEVYLNQDLKDEVIIKSVEENSSGTVLKIE